MCQDLTRLGLSLVLASLRQRSRPEVAAVSQLKLRVGRKYLNKFPEIRGHSNSYQGTKNIAIARESFYTYSSTSKRFNEGLSPGGWPVVREFPLTLRGTERSVILITLKTHWSLVITPLISYPILCDDFTT